MLVVRAWPKPAAPDLALHVRPTGTRYVRHALRRQAVALFTGIVQGKADVERLTRKEAAASFWIRFPPGSLANVQIGASIALNGTCLTVVEADGDCAGFDVIGETLTRTNLGLLQEGSAVNYERSAKVGDEIGGHNVSGHVCCTAPITDLQESPNNRRLQFKVSEPWIRYILPKGFVAVDGMSLTVGEVGPDWFAVYLIPETLRVTTIGAKGPGDLVNIEVDSQTQAIVETAEEVVKRLLAEGRLKALSVA